MTITTKTLGALAVACSWIAALAPLPATAEHAAEVQVLRVDVPLRKQTYGRGEIRLGGIIANETYIDVNEFYLRAIELDASTDNDGSVRLKVGRYVTPSVPIAAGESQGALRIEAPHRSNKKWRLLINDRIDIYRLTAILEPRSNRDIAYYETRYRDRYGYTLYDDYDSRYYGRQSNWPFNDQRRNTLNTYWYWLNDTHGRYNNYRPWASGGHRQHPTSHDRHRRHRDTDNRRHHSRDDFRDDHRAAPIERQFGDRSDKRRDGKKNSHRGETSRQRNDRTHAQQAQQNRRSVAAQQQLQAQQARQQQAQRQVEAARERNRRSSFDRGSRNDARTAHPHRGGRGFGHTGGSGHSGKGTQNSNHSGGRGDRNHN